MTAPIRATLVLLCCAALGLGAQGGGKSDKELRDAFEKAKSLVKKGQIREAAQACAHALELAEKKYGKSDVKTAPFASSLAGLYALLGKNDEAESLFRRALGIYDKKPAGNETALAQTLRGLAWLYVRQNQFDKAEPLFQRALKVREAKHRGDHLDVAESLFDLGRLYSRQNRLDKAEPLLQRALQIREAKLSRTDPAVAPVLNELARVYHERNRLAEAEPLYKRAVAIGEKGRAAGRPEPADPLDNLGRLYREQQRYAEAEPLIRRGLEIREKTPGPDRDAQVVASLNNLGGLYDQQGRYADAERQYRRALGLQEKRLGKDHPEVGLILRDLVLVFAKQGRYADAEPLCQRALKILVAAHGEDHPDATAALDDLAGLCFRQGRYAEAEPHYLKALKLREDKFGPDDPKVAVSLNNLAALYEWQARFKEAEPLLQRSLKIRENEGGADTAEMANALNNLAWLYKQDKTRYAEAEALYKRSLKLREDKHGKDHPDVAAVLNNLAALYGRQDRFQEAEASFRRALRIWEVKGKDHPDAAAALHNLALLYERQKRYAEAEPLYQRALKIREARLSANHPAVAATRNSLAVLYAATGKWRQAADLFQKARRDLREHLRLNLAPLGPPQQLAYLARRIEPDFHAALTLASVRRGDPGMAELAAAWLLNGKGQTNEALAEPLALARAARSGGSKAVYEQLLQVRGQAAFLTLEPAPPGREDAHREELGRLLRRERVLAGQLARAGGRWTGPDWIELAELRRALPADAVFVDFIRHGAYDFKERRWKSHRYLACVVPPAGRGAVALLDLGPAEPIEKAAQAVRLVLRDPGKSIGELGEPEAEHALKERLGRLAERVLQPLLPRLAKAPKWVVGPDATLWLVPFEALPLADGRYAVEGHSIRYVVSGRDLLVPGPNAVVKPGPALVLADPDFDLPPDAGGPAADSEEPAPGGGAAAAYAKGGGLATAEKLPVFARLPGTASEAAAVIPALEKLTRRPPVLKTDKDAREQLVKAARRPRVLVLSTHGYFLPDQEAAVPELFADALQAALSKSGKPLEHPLLRSGLALAGANRRGTARADGTEDGILTGFEVCSCDLTGTELVALSACETGLGQVNNGEGVAGLRQAFHQAGARAVLASLWRIPDRPTAELMAAFFEELAKGKGQGGQAEALRRAQLRQIERRRELDGAAHPFFWAGFTLTAVGGAGPRQVRPDADSEGASN
jgi:tetratricopeptide (TPR) repeat protein/CHAT domain-containing protein